MSDFDLKAEERTLAIAGCLFLFTMYVIVCIAVWLIFGEA